MEEIWKTFIDKYQVSNLGRVRNSKHNRILVQSIRNGYPSVSVSINNTHKSQTVHKMVAICFIENKLQLLEVNHINGIKTDNRVENLEWCTRAHNQQHAIKSGLLVVVQGEDNGRSKLTNSQVKEIKELKGKLSQKKIAEMFNVCEATISHIMNNKFWKSI